ncbi:MAG: amino acid/amide ABC transporter membrane protein 2, HAAT family [Candidatus Kentron sp. G]|nr:MAG: amino acid/amide ABC transporter membrane protein 2, HAAT family [Candidatus Kentron sp. G]VFM99983.1 MAG: amino acid/amide ABC transporter membrane protein 2, HAAT family [Candidatus Kentron sp. G]VFN01238.1 MAG: amino acid/amide ABC transporter membrane protein 2, HAAT family [Candidatus Kentron sp. G]
MIYRETGQYKCSYGADQQIFPIRLDRIAFALALLSAFLIVPFTINDYWEKMVFLPFLIFSLAAIGLNILTGYCGQLSLGSGGFMAVGAYSAYKLMTAFPELSILVVIPFAGLMAAAVGIVFGLPSLRIKGFYLAVATLAAQFFLVWLFNKVPWFYNDSATGQITVPARDILGITITGPNAEPWATYLFCLIVLTILALAAKNMLRSKIGRSWMAIRDMDIAAEIIGVSPLTTKLSAFAVSSFYIGVAGALYFMVWFGAVEPNEAFGINQSFFLLFVIIIGGLGSMLGSFLGAAFLVLMPIALKNAMVDGLGMDTGLAKHVEIMLVGALIILFLIVEPHGLARLWSIVKEKLRTWPFPY